MQSNSKIGRLIPFITRKSSQMANKIAPGWASSKVDELMFVPKPDRKKTTRIPKEFKQFTLNSPQGQLQAYRTGSGPTVVFVHGWGGAASQFFSLMRGLSQCGFSALAFDHLGHGQSDEKQTTIEQSILTTIHVLKFVTNNPDAGLCALVGHSTGCIAMANAGSDLIREIPLFLISPVFNYRLYFLKKLVRLNLHSDIVKRYAAEFGRVYKRLYEPLELSQNLPNNSDISVIVHDKSDNESALTDSEGFCQKYPLTRLVVTHKYDHYRIINSESVWHELKSHLNYDDTTINFIQNILPESPE